MERGRLSKIIRSAIVAPVLVAASACSSGVTTSPPPPTTTTTTVIGTSTTETSSQPPCPLTESEALELAAQNNNGGLPSDASINTAAMICASGWAAGAVESPSAGNATVIYRVVNGAWQVYVLGTDLCTAPDDKQKMSIAPAPIRTAAGC